MKRKLLIYIFYPIILILKLFSLFYKFKFGFVDAERIGHFCLLDNYISKKKFYKFSYKEIFYLNKEKVSNYYLFRLYKKEIKFINNKILLWLIISLKFFKQNQLLINFSDKDIKYSYKKKGLVYKYSNFENSSYFNYKNYICIHNRDASFLNKKFGNKDFDYHKHRDFSIHSMKDAIQYLLNLNYKVIRVGKENSDKINLGLNPNYFDYTNSNIKSDEMDFKLFKNCSLYIGSDSGIFTLASLYQKPFSFINFPSISALIQKYHWNSLPSIFQIIVDKKSKSKIHLNDIFKYDFDKFLTKKEFDVNGIELINNSSKDIVDHVKLIINKKNYMEKNEIFENFIELYLRYNKKIPPSSFTNTFLNNQFLYEYFSEELL